MVMKKYIKIVICVSGQSAKSFLAEAQPRLETGDDKRHFLAEVQIRFFRRPHELQSKRYHCVVIPFLENKKLDRLEIINH
jgi:hypothetical protein